MLGMLLPIEIQPLILEIQDRVVRIDPTDTDCLEVMNDQ